MRFSVKTDYGLRILIFMQKENSRVTRGNIQKIITAGDLADTLKISYLYLMKFMKDLREAGIICSIQGSKGGFMLNKAGKDISVYDVVKAVEGEVMIFSCCYRNEVAKGMEECPYDKPEQCGIYMMMHAMEADIIKRMKAITVEDLCHMEDKKAVKTGTGRRIYAHDDLRTVVL